MSTSNKRVAVIGAGISGVVTAAHLKKEGLDVTVFERSSAAGGIWFYDERKPLEPAYPSVLASKAWSTYAKEEVNDLELKRLLHAPPGPCYIGLKNNVATRLLENTLNKFPPGTEDFVSHSVLKDYIQDTAKKTAVDAVTQYNTEVQNVSKNGEKWAVRTATLQTRDDGSLSLNATTSEFDAVVVASGHYHAARVPDIPGLADWKRAYPSRVQHSKGYRKPEDFQGKNFLLIGGSVSSTDIARELGPIAHTIYQSHRNGTFDLSASLLPENGIRVDEVVSFELPTDTTTSTLHPSDPIPLTATLKSGQKLCDIHHVILCTGYHIMLPFLPHLHSDTTPVHRADERILVTDGTMFHNLHKDIFYIPDPSLAFVGVPFFTATFTLFDFQAMVVAKVFAGLATLPREENMRREYDQRVETKGYGKVFHSLRGKEEEYVDDLLEWVNADLERKGKRRLEGHSESWREAREEHLQRIKALFSAPTGEEKRIGVTYLNLP
ncbi:FAD dependent oxidoreductase [Macroventuria anomochaeta]|uniref:FAD dependent oxidoreductase n=1 Tax=Macroventuria anomochaeta TaxID=301207 RepID=A0ACB6RY11_9PLEO|nr:FAD dependent oxidoreductase [Macroventuria anomochaeta]KAF2626305.1 FAD dependent oxidoreductase [Macroventuria anomochaeta]